MPTILGPPFPPEYAGLPTHMSTEDYTLWLRYRQRLIGRARALYFDVNLGADAAQTAAAGTLLQNMWRAVNAKRADVVADLGDSVKIIELRNNAQANAVGRLLTYRMLWARDPKLKGPVALELVTNSNDPDVFDACASFGIVYTVI